MCCNSAVDSGKKVVAVAVTSIARNFTTLRFLTRVKFLPVLHLGKEQKVLIVGKGQKVLANISHFYLTWQEEIGQSIIK